MDAGVAVRLRRTAPPSRYAVSGTSAPPTSPADAAAPATGRYSHSMVPGGLLVTSSTTRLTSGTSLVIRVEIRAISVVRQPRPVGGHRVLAGHRPQHDRVPVRAAVALHADAAHVGQQHHRELPDVAVEPGRGQLVAGDHVGGPQHVEPVAGDLADDPDGQARARGTGAATPSPRAGPSSAPERPHLVLEQRAQRLDQRELQVVRQPADVVVGLDVRGAGAAAGLDHVRVERALHQELDVAARRRSRARPPRRPG